MFFRISPCWAIRSFPVEVRESFNFLIDVSKLLAQAELMPSERSTVVSLPIKFDICRVVDV
jgi:hypothetical protein